jgi:hypothetical protein
MEYSNFTVSVGNIPSQVINVSQPTTNFSPPLGQVSFIEAKLVDVQKHKTIINSTGIFFI